MSDKPIVYVTHPVKPEVKTAILAKGQRIIDAEFAPEGEPIIDGKTGDAYAPDSHKMPADGSISANSVNFGSVPIDTISTLTRSAVFKMKKADVFSALTARGFDVPSDTDFNEARKALADLIDPPKQE